MQQPGLHGRHRDKDGEISRKHGNTLISTLRRIYGRQFAAGCKGHQTLAEVLEKLDESSLTHLVHDHERGQLAARIRVTK